MERTVLRSDDTRVLTWRNLAMRLTEVRRRAGYTQVKMALLVGVSQSHVSDVERLASKPSIEFVLGVGEKLPWVNRTWLLTGKGRPYARTVSLKMDGDGIGTQAPFVTQDDRRRRDRPVARS
jgi:DNA-binding XRE family transcriptional regulator